MGRTARTKSKLHTPFRPYESPYKNDRFVRMPEGLLCSPQYIGLSNSAKVLYSYMRDWAKANEEFDYAESMIIGLGVMTGGTFRKARDELVERGFIEYTNKHNARDKRQSGHYRFSRKWHGLFQQKENCRPHGGKQKPLIIF